MFPWSLDKRQWSYGTGSAPLADGGPRYGNNIPDPLPTYDEKVVRTILGLAHLLYDESIIRMLISSAHEADQDRTWSITDPPSPANGWLGATGEGDDPLFIC